MKRLDFMELQFVNRLTMDAQAFETTDKTMELQ